MDTGIIDELIFDMRIELDRIECVLRRHQMSRSLIDELLDSLRMLRTKSTDNPDQDLSVEVADHSVLNENIQRIIHVFLSHEKIGGKENG